jgi:double-GTPase-like protein
VLILLRVLGIAVGLVLGPPLVALACALALPVWLIWTLTSAIWAGTVRPVGGRADRERADRFSERVHPDFRSRVTTPAANGAAANGAAANGAAADYNEDPQPAGRAIELGAKDHPDRLVALRSFYYGPALGDLRAATTELLALYPVIWTMGSDVIGAATDEDEIVYMIVAGWSVAIGLTGGYIVGSVLAAAVWLVYAVLSVVLLAASFVTSWILRYADVISCFVYGVTRTCTCGDRILTCPYYNCPDCGERHRDIRPGAFGVVRRTCTCGKRMPTMLVTGRYRLTGSCPRCAADLPPRFGRVPEIVIPLFGPPNVGKTRLMYMMTEVLREWVRDQHGEVVYVGDARERLDMIGDALQSSQHTDKTLIGPSTAIAMHIKFGLHNRLVYFFDAAGEMFSSHDLLAELKFLNKARTYVFVADALSGQDVWAALPEADRERLEHLRTSADELDRAFQATTAHMRRVAVPARRSGTAAQGDLAFVVSKLDLLESAGLDITAQKQDTPLWVSSEAGLGLEDIARGARLYFATVRYFCTAARGDEYGVDGTIWDLMGWIFSRSGVRMGA